MKNTRNNVNNIVEEEKKKNSKNFEKRKIQTFEFSFHSCYDDFWTFAVAGAIGLVVVSTGACLVAAIPKYPTVCA